ncbi:MAG TPA: hypothetical protein DCP63_11090, partial [Bacteroidetes bacterium]|nr:hypothetical protein [Bacteroidota bacterium]
GLQTLAKDLAIALKPDQSYSTPLLLKEGLGVVTCQVPLFRLNKQSFIINMPQKVNFVNALTSSILLILGKNCIQFVSESKFLAKFEFPRVA